jgi:hypothetical protein
MATDEEKSRSQDDQRVPENAQPATEQSKPAPSRWERLWAFFNGPLGLWILSTVFVTFLGWAYAQLSSDLAHKRENEMLIARFDIEIANHIDEFRDTLTVEYPEEDWQKGLAQLLRSALCLQGDPNAYENVFPEYKGRSTSSLIWELRAVTSGRGDKERLRKAHQAARDLFFETHRKAAHVQAVAAQGDKTASAAAVKQVIAEILRKYFENGCPLMDKRWSEQFSKTDRP